MAKRAKRAVAPSTELGIPLPKYWRSIHTPWRIYTMLAKVPPDQYEAVAIAFERHHWEHGTLSTDWLGEFKKWCRARLVEGAIVPDPIEITENMFG